MTARSFDQCRWNFDRSHVTINEDDPRDPRDVLSQQGIHPHPGPGAEVAAKEKMDDEGNVKIICRNIRSLNSNLVAGLTGGA